MRYIFYCSNCDFTGSDDENKANNPPVCPSCGNPLYYSGVTQEDWRSKNKEDKALLKNEWKLLHTELKKDIENRRINHMLTSGYNFEGYKIVSYNGIVSGEIVLGTGFMSELSASFSDFFGTVSEEFSIKMAKAKELSTLKMIAASVSKGGNAIIGVDFDYTTFGSNMVAVSANGTSVKVEKI